MSQLHRLVMIRHGETVGNSNLRFYGSTDVELSDVGRDQLRAAAGLLGSECFDIVVASPLHRSWEGASIVAAGAAVRLESGFREIDFGRWEGLTQEEIESTDPIFYQDWQEKLADFDFPGGEKRSEFRERVLAGLGRLEASGATSALLVVHKGIIRTISEHLLGERLPHGEPPLAGCVDLTRTAGGSWIAGRRASDPTRQG